MTTPWCTLILGDWRDHADTLRDMQPAACITDPPYGLGLKGAGVGRKTGAHDRVGYKVPFDRMAEVRRGSPAIVGDDAPSDVSDVFTLAPRTIMWGADHLRASLPAKGGFLVWDKLKGREAYDGFSDAEMAFDTKAGKVRIFRWLWKGLCTDGTNRDAFRWHQMMKPVQLMEWCIERAGLQPGDLVVDPYMGSASTAVACYRRSMRFVGCEIDRKWFDLAVERLAEQCPPDMFDHGDPPRIVLAGRVKPDATETPTCSAARPAAARRTPGAGSAPATDGTNPHPGSRR